MSSAVQWLATHGVLKRRGVPLSTTISQLGLDGNLKLCLDAAHSQSYASGQKWLDLSGNGTDFFLGADDSATATDPTFHGSAGRLSRNEYFSHDGGDYFAYDAANETWMENLHKDGAVFSAAGWVWPGSLSAIAGICGTRGTVGVIGATLRITTGGALHWFVTDGGATVKSVVTASGEMPANAWCFFGVSIDETVGTNGIILFTNAGATLNNSAYGSPSAAAASNGFNIGASGGGGAPLTSNSRLGMIAAWDIALTQSDLADIFNATRGRYGVAP